MTSPDSATNYESHFRLGIAVHRAECLFATLFEAMHEVSESESIDLVDTALMGATTPAARLPTLLAVAFGLTATAITLWEELGFQDDTVLALLCHRAMPARLRRSRSAVFHGNGLARGDLAALTGDMDAHLDWVLAVIGAIRSYLIRFQAIHFSGRNGQFCAT
jgi:hypothetical protein